MLRLLGPRPQTFAGEGAGVAAADGVLYQLREALGENRDDPLSGIDSPLQFGKRLGLSGGSRQFVRMWNANKLSGQKIDSKNYRLYLRHLPDDDMDVLAHRAKQVTYN